MSKSTTSDVLKVLAKNLGLFAVLYICFRYWGDFSNSQSITLTVLSLVGYDLYGKLSLSRKAEDVFTPFCVTVHPNWYGLLSDFKLIRGEDEWKRLYEEANKISASKFNAFQQGFWFTVIRQPSSNSLPPGLAFWNNENIFLNELELTAPVIPPEEEDGLRFGRWKEKHKFFDHPNWSTLPRIVFKWGSGGYEIGLEVQLNWWEELCKTGELKELAKIRDKKDHLCGTTRLIIATLPYSEFEFYYHDVDYGNRAKLQAHCDNQLEANGWKRKIEADSEIRDPWSHVEHKYFSVSHREI